MSERQPTQLSEQMRSSLNRRSTRRAVIGSLAYVMLAGNGGDQALSPIRDTVRGNRLTREKIIRLIVGTALTAAGIEAALYTIDTNTKDGQRQAFVEGFIEGKEAAENDRVHPSSNTH